MPRVTLEQAELNRDRIEHVSAQLFREMGIDRVSVIDLMKAAGLTHGGFYGHFKSKDELAAIACTRAFDLSRNKWHAQAAQSRSPTDAIEAIIGRYLSEENRDAPGKACPAAMLASDVARVDEDKPVRAAYRAGLDDLLDSLTALQPQSGPKTRRRRAIAQLSTMVGALLLARASGATALSGEILDATRKELLSDLKEKRP
ncbi:TetR/AcrR family transcriptional regulator [Herbaspirillum sp. BH-1]|uniref:TetR/AcrR family transcriptional repressor of nem operon n=2 Tax=Herbaspirillum frisingense TaxID=92645 RepID=A0ABU1PHV2_9BURK|nr:MULTISPECIES: TetR family transcriptional regulator [Herbaspirillum]MCI1012901.1 TetR family transcriptional regulator [Herbaspirillum sp. C7C2]MDR6585424.1 TetR/AcrR family transcriptional repressor of nem operon [Herbaspirillum frisingense]PLY59182.1 TetR/AcrR family transcriptional regulator [Herbaspirillum sp. BH-1]UIN22506.1 TetR family transcriptional regulator [Herbaspirillum frisingense]